MKGPAYRVLTERLCIRCWSPSDAPLAQEAILQSLDHLRPSMPWIADEPLSLDDRMGLLRLFRARFDGDDDYIYAIFDRDETQVLGGTGLHKRVGPEALEIGYWIRPERARQGLITESTAALVRVAFEVHEAQRVEIHCAPSNVASAGVPRKLLFTHDATLRARTRTPGGQPRDTMVWSMLKSELAASPAARARVEAFDALGRPLLG
ncbi:MAG: GNAT family N-acetyltransferase [Sandaracinaceae bacterium]|nr:GNAT family N-acetyltransferase [Sandaracinaceae bacterium]